MWDLLQKASSARFSHWWAVTAWLCDMILTLLIIRRVPFTNIDWEAYMMEVDCVLRGEFDYSKISGPTGPIAYPAGFCWFYGALRWLELPVPSTQLLFGALYLAMLAVVFAVYRAAEAPGWLLMLCVLSKRVHSIFCLRLFNDGVSQLFLYLSLLFLLRQRHLSSALTFSLAISIKMQPLLYCPAIGLCFVLAGGWSHALQMIVAIAAVQLAVALPFLWTNPMAYLGRAFGGPGDLQHVWSVNWRMIPEAIFADQVFAIGLHLSHVVLLVWFAHHRWIPGGWLSQSLRHWTTQKHLDAKTTICVWFACNFVGVACLRTMHFQFLVWYFHSVPFLAWFALKPDEYRGLSWACRCVAIVILTLAIEVPFLLTTNGTVRGPDGRSWETAGVPTSNGSVLLQGTHAVLLVALAMQRVHTRPQKEE
mmetsp:Transcript_126109/g.251830  ORF Transcript_126109/g.251830 Transcript_126109/m.251830 type:complete len:421 (+) Transcript_126109:86-1348(+)